MKIVHELNQLDYGGVERVIRNIVKYDKKNEHTILAYKDGPFRSKLEEVGAKIIVTGDKEGDEVDMEADVIHIHSGGQISELASSLGYQFPVVETIHSPIRSPMPNKVLAQRVGVSETVSKMNDKCITIKNGLDFDELQATKSIELVKSELGIPEGIPVIGRLGRLGKDKGLEDWILACYLLQKKGHNFVPLIIGDEARDCQGYRGKLKLMCESLPLKGVKWVGLTEDIANYYQVIDIFLYPSATEGFGLVMAEAIYKGCTVVTYQTPVNFELFGGYAVFSPKGNIEALASHTEAVLKSIEVRDEIVGIGPSFIESEYEASRMSEEYQELYERCNLDFNRSSEPQAEHAVSA